MSGAVLVRGARQLLTLHGSKEPRRGSALNELGVILDGAVLIQDGRILEAGPSSRVENLTLARTARVIDAGNRVVMPGFVDCHTHLMGGSDRQEVSLQNISGGRLESRARQVINLMARHGTTTLEAKSGFGADESGELKILRANAACHRDPLDISSTFLCPNATGAEYPNDPDGYITWICSQLTPKIKDRRLAHYADCRWEESPFDAAQMCRFLETAKSLGFRLKVHTSQFQTSSAVKAAVSLGAASADHLEFAGAPEVELLSRSNTIAVLLPASVLQRPGLPRPPARELIAAGAAIALGSDFEPHASPTCNMQLVLSLACGYLKMTPAEAICAATFNAACAIGYEDMAGSLEKGKLADLIVVNAEDYREIPYYFGGNLVAVTVKRGETIYRE